MADDPLHPRLLITPAIPCDSNQPYSVVSAWLYMITTIEKSADWMCASPCRGLIVNPVISSQPYDARIDRYTPIKLDGLMYWKNIISHTRRGQVATGTFLTLVNVVFKTIDTSRFRDGHEQFNKEVEIYKKMEALQ
ncbi:hypothetical protein HDV03_000443, partial [Kappamyces sp. JEL0829]